MANWGNLIAKVGQLQGSKGTVTLGAKQMLAAAKKAGMSEKHLQEIGEILGRAKKPQVDIAYKVSDQGFTVAAARLRDDKKVLGNIAASVTDLGTETPAVKMRMSIGENGKYYTGRGWVDLGGNYNVDDVAMNVALKNGVWEGSSHIGTLTAVNGKLNAKATIDDLQEAVKKLSPDDAQEIEGLTYQSAIDKVNELANSWLKYFREAVSGKQRPRYDGPDKVADFGDVKVKSIDEIFQEFRKNKLNTDKKIDEEIVQDIFEKRPAEGKNINLDKFKDFLDGLPDAGKKSVYDALDEACKKYKNNKL